jgi:hypothetical protein
LRVYLRQRVHVLVQNQLLNRLFHAPAAA